MDKREDYLFEELVMPHLDAGYNFARWLLGDAAKAEGAMHDAASEAFRSFSTLSGGESKTWFLAIVRSTCQNALEAATRSGVPDVGLEREVSGENIQCAIEALPALLREVLILRELEDMSYREIAAVIGSPEGTVISRLACARERLVGGIQ